MKDANKIRILIADDHTLVREGIRSLLQTCSDIEVAGEAVDGRQAIEKTRALQPDIVLMDVAMPGLGGLEATMEIRSNFPHTKVLVLTQYDTKEYVFRFLKAGASGYVLKKAASAELISAIRAIYLGGSFLYPEVAGAVIDGFLNKREELSEDPYEALSEREKEVLKLVAESYSNKEIANLLCVSVKTVMGHRAHLMQKLQIHSRTDLVKFAIRKHLIEA